MGWRHIDSWQAAKAALGLQVSGPVEITLSTGVLVADLLVENFGAPKGMVVATDANTIEPHAEALLASGYGYSSFEPPADGEQVDVSDLLSDWGWSGPADREPSWLSED